MIELVVGALLVAAAFVAGRREGTRSGADRERLKYREAYAALADGQMPPEPKERVVVVTAPVQNCVQAPTCGAMASKVCKSGCCAKCCQKYCEGGWGCRS